MENKEQAAAPEKKSDLSLYAKRTIKYAIALVLFLVATNPSILFFLPDEARESLRSTWGKIFGNVDNIKEAIKINFVGIFQIIAIILLMLFIVNLVKLVMSKISPKPGKWQSICSMIVSFTSYAAVLLGIIMSLSALGVNMSTIFASIGIVALVVGFAAESLIADIITGIFLVFEDEFNVGDIVEINGFRGTVQSIGVRVTTIKDLGGNIKVINNSGIRDVLNRSKVMSRAVCDAPISYSEDIENAEKVVNGILDKLHEKYPDIFEKRPEYLGVQELGSSSVNLRIVAEVREDDFFDATRKLNREVRIGFANAGIEIPFQQVVVHQAK